MSFGFGRPQVYRTTDTRLALFLVSIPYGTGYSALLSHLPSLNPLCSSFALKVGKRSARLELYSVVKVLLFFQLNHPTKGAIVILQNEPTFT